MKDRNKVKSAQLTRRHRRVRRKIRGTAERPRLVVTRSLKHVAAQIVDDDAHRTIVQVSSTAASLREPNGEGSLKMRRSAAVGAEVAKLALENGVKVVTFDRGGRRYHGRVRALADAVRKGGLEF